MSGWVRFLAALITLGCCALVGLAAWLRPDQRGYGTHQQLGFGKCAMLVTTGLPCATCGMTTAFAYAVRGRLDRAFLAQPTGLLLALATVAGALGGGWVVATGRTLPFRTPIITPYRLFFGLLILLVGSWGFKIVVGFLNGTLPDRL
ncbi:MAG: DUF2752 domain-containing protein [Phycisphaerae bacterium]